MVLAMCEGRGARGACESSVLSSPVWCASHRARLTAARRPRLLSRARSTPSSEAYVARCLRMYVVLRGA